MEQSKAEMFIVSNRGLFPLSKVNNLYLLLEQLPDEKFILINTIPYKNPIVMFLYSFFFGCLGVDRFMLGQIGLGILKLITCGGLGIWTIIDWFIVMNLTREWNWSKLSAVTYVGQSLSSSNRDIDFIQLDFMQKRYEHGSVLSKRDYTFLTIFVVLSVCVILFVIFH